MSTEYDASFKTLGSQSASLFVELGERNKTSFNLRDVEEITGLQASSARTLIHKAHKRGLLTRLQPGLYTLVPFELGRVTEYVGDPYVIAKELCGGKDYFLSHASAMELHRIVTQPQFTIYVSSSLRKPSRNIHGYEYHFVTVKSEQVFGLTQIWVNKQQAVIVSDVERTIIDALRQPQYAGGIPEVAKALWISKSKMSVSRLLEYSLRFHSGALMRRLGFLLELYQMALPEQLEQLRSTLTDTYQRLDPTLPRSGHFHARWKLQLNIDIDELRAIPHT
jgi:predicted transcriptional regulator of viral defense system